MFWLLFLLSLSIDSTDLSIDWCLHIIEGETIYVAVLWNFNLSSWHWLKAEYTIPRAYPC